MTEQERGRTTHEKGPQDVTAKEVAKGVFNNPGLLFLGIILLVLFKPLHAAAIVLFAVGVGLLLFYPTESIDKANELYVSGSEHVQSALASVEVPELTRQLGFIVVVSLIVAGGMTLLLYWMVKNNPDGALSVDHDFERYKDDQ